MSTCSIQQMLQRQRVADSWKHDWQQQQPEQPQQAIWMKCNFHLKSVGLCSQNRPGTHKLFANAEEKAQTKRSPTSAHSRANVSRISSDFYLMQKTWKLSRWNHSWEINLKWFVFHRDNEDGNMNGILWWYWTIPSAHTWSGREGLRNGIQPLCATNLLKWHFIWVKTICRFASCIPH